MLGKGVLADEPRPEFAGGATCEIAAVDGLLGEEAGALFDGFDHFFAGEDVGKEVAFVTFFVGVLGIDEVEAAAGGVVLGIGTGAGLFEVGVGGGVVHRQESRFDPTSPVGSGRFEGLMAELAAADMPPAILTNLQTKQQNCVQKEIEQEYFKRIRKRLARQRIKKYNALYKMCTSVRDAAQSVFINEPEERGLFTL